MHILLREMGFPILWLIYSTPGSKYICFSYTKIKTIVKICRTTLQIESAYEFSFMLLTNTDKTKYVNLHDIAYLKSAILQYEVLWATHFKNSQVTPLEPTEAKENSPWLSSEKNSLNGSLIRLYNKSISVLVWCSLKQVDWMPCPKSSTSSTLAYYLAGHNEWWRLCLGAIKTHSITALFNVTIEYLVILQHANTLVNGSDSGT